MEDYYQDHIRQTANSHTPYSNPIPSSVYPPSCPNAEIAVSPGDVSRHARPPLERSTSAGAEVRVC